MKLLRRWAILVHRYLGIVLSLLFFVWFASGIAMVYAGGMPRLEPGERLRRMPPLDPAAIRVTPADAAERAGGPSKPNRLLLLTVMGRPAYRFSGDTTVFADSGELLETVGPGGGLEI